MGRLAAAAEGDGRPGARAAARQRAAGERRGIQPVVALTVNGTPITLPAADVRVEELRGEAFAQGTWRPSDKLSFEAGVRVERSTITESGDISLERSFTYPKPRLVATWSPTKTDQLRLRVEREVGQQIGVGARLEHPG